MAEIVLIRHGETAWSRAGRHAGRTDIPLTSHGEAAARSLAGGLAHRPFGLVLVSPLARAVRTAALAGLPSDDRDPDLVEWDYGEFEGRTTPDIRRDLGDPGWSIWDARIGPGSTPGEQPDDVADRCRRVLARCAPVLASGRDCALVAHGHLLRILTATWLDLAATCARLWALDAGALSALGHEHEQRVIQHWNVPAPAADG
ncbi:MAG: histidine phosphatase family protein [Actinomycetota bacterium]|nr:MAG: histidine phosphatase family protein [Actinomycetota bacterium]